MNVKTVFYSTLALLTATYGTAVFAAEEVNVYSGRKEALIKPALDEFTQKTGIKVNLVTGKSDALLKRLQSEGKASEADLFIAADVGRLHRAKEAGVLQSVDSELLTAKIPQNLRDTENNWFGLTLRARPIFYVKGKVKPEELSSYENLTDEKWQGKVCIRSSSNIYNQSLVASILIANGEQDAQAWLNGFVKNFARSPAGGDTDQLRAAAAGECDVAIANTYYYGRLANSSKAEDKAVADKLGLFWPNQTGRGTHVNVSGAGVTKSAKNKAQAIKLIEFMASPKTQMWYAEVNNEYPVVESVEASSTLAGWGAFKSDEVALSQLGESNRTAVLMMDKAGWK
ncbi:MAG: Fe(3+) ABC transporter substrate-binding protein [Arenicella sp.]